MLLLALLCSALPPIAPLHIVHCPSVRLSVRLVRALNSVTKRHKQFTFDAYVHCETAGKSKSKFKDLQSSWAKCAMSDELDGHTTFKLVEDVAPTNATWSRELAQFIRRCISQPGSTYLKFLKDNTGISDFVHHADYICLQHVAITLIGSWCVKCQYHFITRGQNLQLTRRSHNILLLLGTVRLVCFVLNELSTRML